MKYYGNPSSRLQGRFRWIAVLSCGVGATVKVNDGGSILLNTACVLYAPPSSPWISAEFTGAVQVLIGDSEDSVAPDIEAKNGTPVAEFADVISVLSASIVQLLGTNHGRRTLGVQNQGVNAIVLSTDPALAVAGGVGSKILAVLAGGSIAYDGSGGSFSLDGYTGPIYARAVGGNSDASVGAF